VTEKDTGNRDMWKSLVLGDGKPLHSGKYLNGRMKMHSNSYLILVFLIWYYKALPATSVRNFLYANFHSCTVHLDTIKVFYLPTDTQQSCYKIILKCTLKQLLHVSVQFPSTGSVLFELAKVTVIKIIS
jgi:hypothetical protein